MTLRIAENICEMVTVRPAVRVRRAAEILDESAEGIYRLIDSGDLEAYYAGRGRHFLRVYIDSISAFQTRKTKIVKKMNMENSHKEAKAQRKGYGSAQHREAMAYLAKQGVLNDSLRTAS